MGYDSIREHILHFMEEPAPKGYKAYEEAFFDMSQQPARDKAQLIADMHKHIHALGECTIHLERMPLDEQKAYRENMGDFSDKDTMRPDVLNSLIIDAKNIHVLINSVQYIIDNAKPPALEAAKHLAVIKQAPKILKSAQHILSTSKYGIECRLPESDAVDCLDHLHAVTGQFRTMLMQAMSNQRE